ncbi:MAG: hypothetical protein Q8R40_01990 [bacterium]|nr:hypothetical protein [bacterium]
MKKLYLYSFALVMISALSMSSIPVSAQEDNTLFCSGLAGREQNKLDKFTSQKSAKNDRFAAQDQTRFTARARADADRKIYRDGLDRAFTAEINILLKLAGDNEGKKKAVMDFQVAITAIRTTRRSTVDSVRSTFHVEKDQIITTRRNGVSAALDARTKAFQDAFAKAKADCTTRPSADVDAELKVALDAARTAFRTAVDKAIQDAQTALTEAKTKRNTAIKAATDTAQAGRQKAKQDFRTAWDAAGE